MKHAKPKDTRVNKKSSPMLFISHDVNETANAAVATMIQLYNHWQHPVANLLFDNTHDLINLLSTNKKLANLLRNDPAVKRFIEALLSNDHLRLFKFTMNQELNSRAGYTALVKMTHGEQYPFSTCLFYYGVTTINLYLFTTHYTWLECLTKNTDDLYASFQIVCALTLLMLLASLCYRDIKFDAFGATSPAEIDQTINTIREKINATTTIEYQQTNYRTWLKHFIWNEKVNQPVAPYVPTVNQAAKALPTPGAAT